MIEHYLLPPPCTEPQSVPSEALTAIPPGTLLLIRPSRDAAGERIVAEIRDRQQRPHI
jgi:hypothetical protein